MQLVWWGLLRAKFQIYRHQSQGAITDLSHKKWRWIKVDERRSDTKCWGVIHSWTERRLSKLPSYASSGWIFIITNQVPWRRSVIHYASAERNTPLSHCDGILIGPINKISYSPSEVFLKLSAHFTWDLWRWPWWDNGRRRVDWYSSVSETI